MKDDSPFEKWMRGFGYHFEPYTLDAMYQQRLDQAYTRALALMELDSLTLDQSVSVVRKTLFSGYSRELHAVAEAKRKRKEEGNA